MKILLIDDDAELRKSLKVYISNKLGHEVRDCSSVMEALKILKKENFHLIVSDIVMPDMSGFDLLEQLKRIPSAKDIDIVLITGQQQMDFVIRALRLGAYDFLTKPIDIGLLMKVLDRVAEHQSLLSENRILSTQFEERLQEECSDILTKFKQLHEKYFYSLGLGTIGFFSTKMNEIVELARKLNQNRNIPVLIEGETGTGKEIIARLIHYGEEYNEKPYITVNCAAIPENLFESELFGYEAGAFTGADRKGKKGKFELAQGGTLLLDEIGEIPITQQSKLLRALEEREIYRVGGIASKKIDVRLICATNKDLKKKIKNNSFREDLYYRINSAHIFIPPLRERKEEIIPLTELFLKKWAETNNVRLKTLSSDCIEFLNSYSWPGNVRQLKSAVERTAFLTEKGELTAADFAYLIDGAKIKQAGLDRTLCLQYPEDELDFDLAQQEIVKKALELFDGNKTQAARYLKISLNRLKRITGKG
jgi:DNA-binding NtrC family response regulator